MARRRNVTPLPPNWSWTWRGDSPFDIKQEWEANCPHGVGHSAGVHGCDGCCSAVAKQLKKAAKPAARRGKR